MTGIEKIVKSIEAQCELDVNEILEDAKKQAKQIEADGKTEAQKILATSKSAIDADFEAKVNNAASAAKLKIRDRALSFKREHIDVVINAAVSRINALPDTEYFSALFNKIRANANSKSGVIKLNAKDLKRDLSVLENLLMSDDSCKNIKIEKVPADIDGGFILDFGDIEINASFAATVSEKREELLDTVNKALFL